MSLIYLHASNKIVRTGLPCIVSDILKELAEKNKILNSMVWVSSAQEKKAQLRDLFEPL